MKIAILTYNFNNNYGGMLQAYALIKYLKSIGHEPELIYVQSMELKFKNKIKYLLKKYCLCYFINRWPDVRYKKLIEANTSFFIDKFINPKTKPVYKKKHFIDIGKKEYDAFLVGSDQVWRARVYRYIDYAFFGFVRYGKPLLLSYAASFGVDKWEYTEYETKKYGEQLARFKAVSVREDSGVELCRKYFNVDAVHVLDPTMLLERSDYSLITENEIDTVCDGGLLTYILDDNVEKLNILGKIKERLALQPFDINIRKKNRSRNINDLVYPSVASWLKGYEKADFVFTDSFHGCVFAIIYNKPFLVYGNKQRGMARFESLLKMFGLEDRLVDNASDIDRVIDASINWSDVNHRLDYYKAESKLFLKKNLTI